MATISISVTGSTVVSINDGSHSITDSDLVNLLTWARATYPSTSTPDTRTDAQVALAWAKSFVSGTKQAVTKFEKDAAAQAAAAAQACIDIVES